MRSNFDANAAVRPLPAVLDVISDYHGQYLNPSSVHRSGQAAKQVLDEARAAIRKLLSLSIHDKIIFTSGATEANNAGLRPLTSSAANQKGTLACSAVEHNAVLETLRSWTSAGYTLREIAPNSISDQPFLEAQLDDSLKLFALMLANNETGQIFNVAKSAAIVRKIAPRARVHCDAVQAVGKVAIDFGKLGIDTLALSGHKLGALSGIGALVIADGLHVDPWLYGGPQESGLRAGTENVLGIKTLAIACERAYERVSQHERCMHNAREAMLRLLAEFGTSVAVNQFGIESLPNTLSIRVRGVKADDLVIALDLRGVAISAGSACTSGRPRPSHVLLAHGLSEIEARETIRVSFEPDVSEAELDFGLTIFREVLGQMISFQKAA